MNKEQSIKLLDEQLSTAYNADVLKKFIYATANGIDRNVIQILFKDDYYKKKLWQRGYIFFYKNEPYLSLSFYNDIFLFKVIDKYITDIRMPGIDYNDYRNNAFNTKRITDEYIVLLCNMNGRQSYDDTELFLIDRFTKKVVYNSLPFSGIYRLRCACIDYFPETKQLLENACYSTDISLKDLKNTQIYDIIRPEMLLFEFLGA
jgi:hypothetical protein